MDCMRFSLLRNQRVVLYMLDVRWRKTARKFATFRKDVCL